MPSSTQPQEPRIVVAGGGFAGLEAIFYLKKRLGSRAQLTLVSDVEVFQFKPNTIYIPFGRDPERYRIPIREGVGKRGIDFRVERVEAVDPIERMLQTDQSSIPFDYLFLATGATMRPGEIPGLAEHAATIWTPEEMMKLRHGIERIVAAAREGKRQEVLFLVPPNNKCSGPLYELVFMTDTWLRRQEVRQWVLLTYATYEKGYIQAFGPRLNETVEREFLERGIAGHREHPVLAIEPGTARFTEGRSLPFDLLVSFPPYVSAVRYEALPHDERGFLRTDPKSRQVEGHLDIYAVGDTGDFPVKQAFLALLQADAAAEHLSERILGEEPQAAFDPVSMCIMEQFDRATFAQVPLRTTGDPTLPVVVREEAIEDYKVGTGEIWRVGKKMLGTILPHRFREGLPFHAGATWATMEMGLKVMSRAFAH